MTARYRVQVAGRVPRHVTDAVVDRFGSLQIDEGGGGTILTVCVADQPALRSLLTALFDVGHEVVSLTREEASP